MWLRPLCLALALCKQYPPSPAFFLGGSPEVTRDSLVYSSADRQKVRTEAMGTIHLQLGVVLRNFDKFGVEFGN